MLIRFFKPQRVCIAALMLIVSWFSSDIVTLNHANNKLGYEDAASPLPQVKLSFVHTQGEILSVF